MIADKERLGNEGLCEGYRAERTGINNFSVSFDEKKFMIRNPDPVIPDDKKQGIQLGAGPASDAEAVVNIWYQWKFSFLLTDR
jgi:hypothetical protein